MSTTKRRSRRRRENRDPIISAWDAGLPPPPKAYLPEHREQVIECLFFRWCDDHARYRGPEHPHYRAWAAALRHEVKR